MLNPPRRFRLLAFDWDGTLADSTALIAGAIQQACLDVGVPAPAESDARHVIGLGHRDAIRHVAPTLAPERHARFSERYRDHYLAGDAAIPLFAGVREMLDELDDRGFLLAVATGKTRVGAASRCGDEGFPKPHPDMLLALMDRLGAEPAETLMIGDTTHDLELARNAGVSALAVAYGAHPSEGLMAMEPLSTAHSVTELRAWLATNA
ncbi:MAG: HAD family hydrolase [Betaproteobacteria bacterium]|nr:MAG: HAD family hydrolase [Betaproteobacteria bacterium]